MFQNGQVDLDKFNQMLEKGQAMDGANGMAVSQLIQENDPKQVQMAPQ